MRPETEDLTSCSFPWLLPVSEKSPAEDQSRSHCSAASPPWQILTSCPLTSLSLSLLLLVCTVKLLSKHLVKLKNGMDPLPDGPQNHRHQQPSQPPPQQEQSSLLSGRIMLMAVAGLFTTIFIVLVIHLCIRYHLLRQARRRRAAFLHAFADQSQNLSLSANRGLDPDLLRSLPITVRSASETPIDCSVCLSKIEEGEKLRVLPKCRHEFHAECIDMWFYSHATCPLCRSTIDTDAPATCNAGTASSSGEEIVRIEEPPVRIDELGLGFGSKRLSDLAVKGLLIRDLVLNRGMIADADLERGEAVEQDPNPISAQSTAQIH